MSSSSRVFKRLFASASRRFFVGGNWKCNGNLKSINTLMETLNKAKVKESTQVVVAPPSVYLTSVKAKLRKDFAVSGQDVSFRGLGAFTGDIAAEMYKDLGIKWTITGHSERRTYHHETSAEVAKKTAIAIKHGLSVIACIGETLAQREAGQTWNVLSEQLQAFADCKELSGKWDQIVVAYEPVWAIGTGKVATPVQAQEAHAFVRSFLSKAVSEEVASKVRILYGGSVTKANAKELGTRDDVDGFLVGGASLKPEFIDIINANPNA
eukprot:TRINITY_DN10297_c0_g1_i1.p1 TRINITY_DN10297_c0_g1~~TRINITY_DN10297_c0_g1_i1.p1  ORF type:complete len:267 (+),score=56.45 TRINITY_DN10297_c0_g1_i1:27-827(+)